VRTLISGVPFATSPDRLPILQPALFLAELEGISPIASQWKAGRCFRNADSSGGVESRRSGYSPAIEPGERIVSSDETVRENVSFLKRCPVLVEVLCEIVSGFGGG
jgi:hypothetical protein